MIKIVQFLDYNFKEHTHDLSPEFQKILSGIKSPDLNSLLRKSEVIQVQKTGRYAGKVTVWDYHQIIIVQDKMTVYTGDEVKKYPKNKFWKTINDIATNKYRELSDQELDNAEETSTQSDFDPFDIIGYYGYIGFEISRLVDDYKHRSDVPSFPYLIFVLPTKYIFQHNNIIYVVELNLPITEMPNFEIPKIELVNHHINHMTKYSDFISNIEKIKSYIAHGDIYQSNFTQSFLVANHNTDFVNLFTEIMRAQNLSHISYMKFRNFGILSLSPELFLKSERGFVITKPIKGTRPRGGTNEEDKVLISQLLNSEKDNAELSMIVDLLRNDLGKSSLPSSVEVVRHAVVETYENVHHLVSTISSRINQSFHDSWRLLIRAFPGGSISGVPKYRSLEIIEELEHVPREVYTGSIGFINFNGSMEFNIAIRTAIFTEEIVRFSAGGGIVYDSDPIEEYLESLHKAKHIARYVGYSFIGHLDWYNGKFVESEHLDITPQEFGCFETILIEHGEPKQLYLHLERLRKGFAYYNLEKQWFPDEMTIHTLVKLNIASSGRMNIYAWKDKGKTQVHIKIKPYARPDPPFNLYLPNKPFDPPPSVNSGVKTLEYNNYRRFLKAAIANHCFDTLLLDKDNYLLEGSRSTIYFYTDRWITPENNVIHGIIRSVLLKEQVVKMEQYKINSKLDLERVKAIAISNALIGIQGINVVYQDGDIIWKAKKTPFVKYLQDALEL